MLHVSASAKTFTLSEDKLQSTGGQEICKTDVPMYAQQGMLVPEPRWADAAVRAPRNDQKRPMKETKAQGQRLRCAQDSAEPLDTGRTQAPGEVGRGRQGLVRGVESYWDR
jgi:hypothetical protein